MEIDHDAVRRMFVVEAEEQVVELEQALVALELHASDEESIHRAFRAAHSLKGNAAMVQDTEISELAHQGENILGRFRSGVEGVSSEAITKLLGLVDELRAMVQKRGGRETPAATEGAEVTPKPQVDGGRTESTRTLRVSTDRLDRMMNLMSELAIARGQMTELLERTTSLDAARSANAELDLRFFELQELVMQVRMVGVAPFFRQFSRTVRELAHQLGKQALLTVDAGDVELDMSILEHLRSPLTHVLRNALDHGIEPPAVRQAAGKDPIGHVTLRAHRTGGRITIEVQDDGAGLDPARVLAAAQHRGFVGAHEAPQLSDVEIAQLIFVPGLSTKEEVTDLSGRGVGMDVVRSEVQDLRGTVDLENRPGAGLIVRIQLPMTVAIIEGLTVQVGATSLVIPIESVTECIALPRNDKTTSKAEGVLNVRGAALPYLRLRSILGEASPPPERESVVVVSYQGGHAGLVVDALRGQGQTILKPLGRIFRDLPAISGGAIQSTGRVALVLDVPGLLCRHLGRVDHPGCGGSKVGAQGAMS